MRRTFGSVPVAYRTARRGVARLLLSCAALMTPVGAAAQTAPPPPPVIPPPIPPTREEVTRPTPPPPVTRAPRLEVEGGVERAPCALDAPEYQNIRFTPREVQFDGLKGLAPADLSQAYAPFIGTDQPISVVCQIRDRAAAILRDAGYIAAVQVPEQRISEGVVHFQVVMAHLSAVRVRGDATGAESLIAGYLGELTKQPVFNRYQAERYLLLASDIPGYTVRLTLRPAGTTPGEVIGDVTVQRTAAYVDANIQNWGSRDLGRWGGLLRGQVFGLTGLGDRTTLAVFSTSDFHEQQTLQLGHDFRLGSQGLTVSGLFTYAWARPSIPGEDDDIDARTLFGTLEVAYPFIRRQDLGVRGSIGMDYVNQSVDLDNIDLSRDRLRVAFARVGIDLTDSDLSRVGYSYAEPMWRLTSLFELRQGLHILNATRDCGPAGERCLGPDDVPPSRIEGRSDATVLRFTTYGEFRPAPKLTFALGLRAQYAWKPLLSFEEFSAGNYTVGRGYDPGTLLGDRGYGTQAEVRFGSRIPPSADKPAFEAYAFWDHAKVHNLDKLFVVDQSNRLHSVGGGARFSFDRFALDTALAVPLTRVGFEDKKPGVRVLVSLTTRLWPWSYQ
jgi:hemolysin activation/secretion protein